VSEPARAARSTKHQCKFRRRPQSFKPRLLAFCGQLLRLINDDEHRRAQVEKQFRFQCSSTRSLLVKSCADAKAHFARSANRHGKAKAS